MADEKTGEDQVEQGPGNHVSEAHPGRYVDPNSGAAPQPGGSSSGALEAQAVTDAPVPQEEGANDAQITADVDPATLRESRHAEMQQKAGVEEEPQQETPEPSSDPNAKKASADAANTSEKSSEDKSNDDSKAKSDDSKASDKKS